MSVIDLFAAFREQKVVQSTPKFPFNDREAARRRVRMFVVFPVGSKRCEVL